MKSDKLVVFALTALTAIMGYLLTQTARVQERLADLPTRLELARGLEAAQEDAVRDTDRLYGMIQECCHAD